MKKIFIVFLAVAIGLFVGCSKQRGEETANGAGMAGNPNNSATMAPADSAKVGIADQDFMNKAAQGGAEEVALGQLAEQNAASGDVKAFGQRMVNDHQAAGDKLKELASKKGVTLNDAMSKDAQKEHDTLAKKKGKDFDKAYMDLMVKDHQEDVAEFQKEADNGTDSDVKAFASQTLPTLQDHLNLAKSTKDSAKNEGKAK